VVGRAEGGEVERDGAAGPTLVRRSADGERPRRVEAGGGRGAHRQLPPSRGRAPIGETETTTTFLGYFSLLTNHIHTYCSSILKYLSL
jgi:hypothetical protein